MKLNTKFIIPQHIKNFTRKASVPALVVGIGGYQAFRDYKRANPEDKKKVLLKDIILLSTTGLGAYGGFLLNKKTIPDESLFIKPIKRFFYTCLESINMPLGGILGGIVGGQVMDTILPTESPQKKKEKAIRKGLSLIEEFDYGSMSRAYGYVGTIVGSTFDNTFSTLSGFSIAREKGLKNKIKTALYEIIAGVIIPVIITMPVTRLTKNMNGYLKTAVMLPTLVGSCFIGRTLGNLFNEKVTEKLTQKELWEEISKRRQALVSWSLNNIRNIKDGRGHAVMKDLEKLDKIEKEIMKEVKPEEKEVNFAGDNKVQINESTQTVKKDEIIKTEALEIS